MEGRSGGDRENSRHEGVTLFAALRLADAVRMLSSAPEVDRLARLPQAGERQQGGKSRRLPHCSEHRLAADKVVCDRGIN